MKELAKRRDGREMAPRSISVENVIRSIGGRINKPAVSEHGQRYEVDELWTYIGRKSNEYWVTYALDRQTRRVVDFKVGKRTIGTLKALIDGLLAGQPEVIRTDKLSHIVQHGILLKKILIDFLILFEFFRSRRPASLYFWKSQFRCRIEIAFYSFHYIFLNK